MNDSANLKLPYIETAQAQKHITHNEALKKLDALVHLSVSSNNLTSPPASPTEGSRYIVGLLPTGAWSGKDTQIAAFQNGEWVFYVPNTGWLCRIEGDNKYVFWSGLTWEDAFNGQTVNPASLVGVNIISDITNRLAVSSANVLFSHEGDHSRVKINKNTQADTASVVYQTNYSGRAEFGLTGDDNFHLKVSPDGVTWKDSFIIDKDTGNIQFKEETKIQKDHDGATEFVVANSNNSTNASAQITIDGPALSSVQMKLPYNNANPYFHAYSISVPIGYYRDFESHIFRSQGGTITYAVFNSSGLKIHNSMTPSVDNSYTCGNATARWASIWAANGVIQTSDERDKNIVGNLREIADKFVDEIEPILFRWKVGGYEISDVPLKGQTPINQDEIDAPSGGKPIPLYKHERAGARIHAGWRAQDFQKIMESCSKDFGVWGIQDNEDPKSQQWLRPDQIIPILWQSLRHTREQLCHTNEKLKDMQTQIDEIRK